MVLKLWLTGKVNKVDTKDFYFFESRKKEQRRMEFIIILYDVCGFFTNLLVIRIS